MLLFFKSTKNEDVLQVGQHISKKHPSDEQSFKNFIIILEAAQSSSWVLYCQSQHQIIYLVLKNVLL